VRKSLLAARVRDQAGSSSRGCLPTRAPSTKNRKTKGSAPPQHIYSPRLSKKKMALFPSSLLFASSSPNYFMPEGMGMGMGMPMPFEAAHPPAHPDTSHLMRCDVIERKSALVTGTRGTSLGGQPVHAGGPKAAKPQEGQAGQPSTAPALAPPPADAGTEYVITLEAPGASREDITLELDDSSQSGVVLIHISYERNPLRSILGSSTPSPSPSPGEKSGATPSTSTSASASASTTASASGAGKGADIPVRASGASTGPSRPRILHTEAASGHMHRTIRLPSTVDTASLRASLCCGLLTLVIPHKHQAGVREERTRIPISSSSSSTTTSAQQA
jgi:HSP20 family molecular chaperone IbpA